MNQTWIITTNAGAVDKLVAVAQRLDVAITVVSVGSSAAAEIAARRSVASVLHLDLIDGIPAEAAASEVAAMVAAAAPQLVLGGTGSADRVLLGAVAGKTGASVLTGVSDISAMDSIRKVAFGGVAELELRALGPVVVSMEPMGQIVPKDAAEPVTVQVKVSSASGMRLKARHASSSEPVNLADAVRVVAIGRGLRSCEDMAMIEELASGLRAEVGCSRPLAEGLAWLPKSSYIGVSGMTIAPSLYLAVGISGQLQHMVGTRKSGTIVAINTDARAPIFAECDYGIVGDLYQVVPALTRALKA